jgi:hypothetical protein
MKIRSPKGFILIYVIALMALMGSALLILTSVSNQLAQQTNVMDAAACARSLKASGYAWALQHTNSFDAKIPAGPIQLGASLLEIPGGKIQINRNFVEPEKKEILIDVSCRVKNISLNSRGAFILPQPGTFQQVVP